MKAKILEILGYAFDPEIAELKAEEIMRLIKKYYKKRTSLYDLNKNGGFKNRDLWN